MSSKRSQESHRVAFSWHKTFFLSTCNRCGSDAGPWLRNTVEGREQRVRFHLANLTIVGLNVNSCNGVNRKCFEDGLTFDEKVTGLEKIVEFFARRSRD
jgi:hypothetical protein